MLKSASNEISLPTPMKLPQPCRRIHHHSHRPQLPLKYDMLLSFFDALDASLKLLRLRKSVPVFSKIRGMVETISHRRFTHQHLAQLKFLLPDEIGIEKVLSPDESTRCMKYDLRLTITSANKRRRGSKHSRLRDRLISRLSRFLRAHPEGTEIPEKELPEPFNQHQQDQLLSPVKQSSSMCAHKHSDITSETVLAQASHLSMSFSKHFSKQGLSNEVRNTIQDSTVPSTDSTLVSTSYPDEDRWESVALATEAVQSKQPTFQSIQNPSDHKTRSFQVINNQKSPTKSAGTTMTPVTPALKTPKMRKLTPDYSIARSTCKEANRPSCARSLMFEGPSRNGNIELHLDDDEFSDDHDILPENLLQSLKKKEAEQTRRKLMIVHLPKMFDRVRLLFHSSKSSAVRKEALIRNLTECHSDITDESEVEEQLKLLQEIIPDWIVNKFSPSGNKLCSINKALDPDILRQQVVKSI
ncbi:hypothetical protein vseg_005245 [Gypsophila vaccaria]